MSRKTKKRREAIAIVSIHYEANPTRFECVKSNTLYREAVLLGYYWNVVRAEWQNIKLTLTHIRSCALLLGIQDNTVEAKDKSREYKKALIAGGILTKQGKRTTKVDLPAKYGNFHYGR